MPVRTRSQSRWKWAGRAAYSTMLPFSRAVSKFHSVYSKYAKERIASLREKLARGEKAYILGIGAGGHNSGIGLIEVSARDGIRLLANHEEERFQGIKHFQNYPTESVKSLLLQMHEWQINPADIHAICAGWDYPAWVAKAVQTVVEELPGSLRLLFEGASPHMNMSCVQQARQAPRNLGLAFYREERDVPIICMPHHGNHAWLSWGCSPFAKCSNPVLVLVIDGAGDRGAISAYLAENGKLQVLHSNDNIWDSVGMMYGTLSSALGGWPFLSSEGRYMGAAAWGNGNRLTNPYYSRLRDVFVFENDGQIFLNRALANWHQGGSLAPFTRRLTEILGPPILPDQMWNPDLILDVERVEHAPITADRLDKAAAVQLVFEDAVFHIVQHLIRTTRCHQLVLTGGSALNCVTNMLLLENFNEQWYERNLGMKDTRLELWIPPVPGDMGVPIGAAYHFASLGGASPGEPLKHAFYCGRSANQSEIDEDVHRFIDVSTMHLGNMNEPADLLRLADFMAYVVSRDGIIGIYQGVAETGPRALGHRSILANPTNPKTRENLNALVKFRELIRPLAPMVSRETAHQWFELAPGAAADDYNAYSYMVLTARARREAYEAIPAVIHKDGTCRIQIVRAESNPLIHAYLQAMGRRVGVEVSVNTSLNVGAPISQTPAQAFESLRRSRGMHGLILVSAEGTATLAWHNVHVPPKDGGRTIKQWHAEWKRGTSSNGANSSGKPFNTGKLTHQETADVLRTSGIQHVSVAAPADGQ